MKHVPDIVPKIGYLPVKSAYPITEVAKAIAFVRASSLNAARASIYRGIKSGKITAARFNGRLVLLYEQVEKILQDE